MTVLQKTIQKVLWNLRIYYVKCGGSMYSIIVPSMPGTSIAIHNIQLNIGPT